MAPLVRSAGCHAQRCTRVSPLAGEPGYTYWGWPDQGGAELLRREGKGWRLDYALVGGAYGGRGVQGRGLAAFCVWRCTVCSPMASLYLRW